MAAKFSDKVWQWASFTQRSEGGNQKVYTIDDTAMGVTVMLVCGLGILIKQINGECRRKAENGKENNQ